MALPEDLVIFAAVRAAEIAVVLHDAVYGNMHHLGHADGLGDDHTDKLLRGCDDNDAVNGQRLEYG